MNSMIRGVVVGSVTGIMLSMGAQADGLRNPPEGVQALGKIGGRIVYIDDASAATHNPANMTDFTNNSAIASVTVGYGKKEFSPDSGGKVESKDNWGVLPNLFASWQIDEAERIVGGLALTTPFGRSTTYDENSVIRYTNPYFTELYAVNLNPSVAYRVCDKSSVALGLDFLYSDLDFRQIYPWSVATGNPAAPDGKSTFEGDGGGIGFNAAINWDITDKQRASLTYRSSIKVDYEGDSKITQTPVAAPVPTFVTSKSDFETSITFPTVIAAGYGIQINDKLRVEANIEWIEHSSFDHLDIDAGNNTMFLPSRTIRTDWDDNWTYGVGADYALNEHVTLRAGYIILETPIPSETMTPSIAEEDQSVISIGFGYNKGAHTFDFAYAYGFFNGRDISNNDNPALNGSYDFESSLIGASYGYTF